MSIKQAEEFGRMMGRMAKRPRNDIFNPQHDNVPKGNGISTIVNSPGEAERRSLSTGDARSQLWGLKDPSGFVNPNSWLNTNRDNRNQLSVAKDPKRSDSPAASPWRSANVSDKVRELSNAKHYNELANMNRANPPRDINGIAASRMRVNNEYNSNAASALPYLFNPKGLIPGSVK
jgi:hypothetical protein